VARIAYLGTPEIAVAPLEGLIAAGHDVALVISRPDARRGRGAVTTPSPVKQCALDHGITVSEDLNDLLDCSVDLAVVVAYGRIIPTPILDSVPMVNLHFSLLPRWRGAAPVERAILAGDSKTGVCVMGVEPTLDTGPVYAVRTVDVDDKTLSELRAELVSEGTDMLCALLADDVYSLPDPTPQIGEASYAAKIDAAELELDFTRSADEVLATVRLERAFTFLDGRRLRILKAHRGEAVHGTPGMVVGTTVATTDDGVVLDTVQPEGKRAIDAEAWRRGLQRRVDVRLGRDIDL